MKENLISVVSASDSILVINIPELSLRRTWNKRGSKFLLDRETMEQAYFTLAVETLFKEGKLVTDDKQFLQDVGLMNEDEELQITLLTEQMMMRMIKNMPLFEFKKELEGLTRSQIASLADFAIAHYTDLAMDRVDLLTKASGKNILKSIENYKAAEEA